MYQFQNGLGGRLQIKTLLLGECWLPTLTAAEMTDRQHNCRLWIINMHPVSQTWAFKMNNYILKKRLQTIDWGGGEAEIYEWDGVKQLAVIHSTLFSPRAFSARSRERFPAKPAETRSWIAICKQAIFLVVNNQQLGGNQLGVSHLFFARLISLYLSSFVNFLKLGFKGSWEKDLFFCPSGFLGSKTGVIFTSSPFRIQVERFRVRLSFQGWQTGRDLWTLSSNRAPSSERER